MSPPRKRRGSPPDPGPIAAGPLSPAPYAYDDPDHGQVGPGGTGSLTGIPECGVCYAQGGGGHGGGCPNAGRDPADWVTDPPDGWARPGAVAGYG